MNTTAAPPWHSKRNAESRMVEERLREAGFPTVDAYRHNSASLRVRIIDERFRDRSREDRDKMVEPYLDQLPFETQADIINLLLMYPGEEKDSFRANLFNTDFERAESNL